MADWLEEKIEETKTIKGFLLVLTSDDERNYNLTLTNGEQFHLQLSPHEKLSYDEYRGLMQTIETTDSFLKLANYYRREERFDA